MEAEAEAEVVAPVQERVEPELGSEPGLGLKQE